MMMITEASQLSHIEALEPQAAAASSSPETSVNDVWAEFDSRVGKSET